MENTIKNLNKLSTRQFIDYVNIHPQIDFAVEIKDHLERTLKKNDIYIDWLKEKHELFPFNELVYCPIETIKDLKVFLQFKNLSYKKLASICFLENANTNILENFYDQTTPKTYAGRDFITNNFPITDNYKFIYGVYKLLTDNSDVFSKNDVQCFIDAYIKTLYNRTTHPATNFEPYFINLKNGVKQLVKPSYHYRAMQGMYFLDAKLLLGMTKYLKENNLSLAPISQVIKDLPFQHTTYSPILQEKNIFYTSIFEIDNIINSKEPDKKLLKKKKLSSKRQDQNTLFCK